MQYSSTKLIFLALAAVVGTGGCNRSGLPVQETGVPIAFGTRLVSKAAVTDKSEIQPFSVWGWCHKTGSNPANLFLATTVSPDGYYGEEQRFWADGFTHDFFAVHPTAAAIDDALSNHSPDREGPVPPEPVRMSLTPEGVLDINSIDCRMTGPDAVDLMTAANAGISYPGGSLTDGRPAPVLLDFRHELARVRFCIETPEACQVAAVLCNAVWKASMTRELKTGQPAWTPESRSLASGIPFSTPATAISPADNPTAIFGGDLLLPPQALAAGTDIQVVLDLRASWDRAEGQWHLNLDAVPDAQGRPVNAWEAGKSYDYLIRIPADKAEIQVAVTVSDWTDIDVSATL